MSIREIATHCLRFVKLDIYEYVSLNFVGYSGQAESIRYTCSRDPARSNQNIESVCKLAFFSKNKTDEKQRKRGKPMKSGYMYKGYLKPISGPMQWLLIDLGYSKKLLIIHMLTICT